MDENNSEIINEVEKNQPDYSGKSLAELSEIFQHFATSEDRLARAKEAEALKSAFYKTLNREKEKLQDGAAQVFDAVEENFKALYAAFKKEKAEYTRQLEAQKADNLKTKLAIIDELKSLVDSADDVSASLPQFRDLQARWRATGAVPVQNFRDVNDTYQLYVVQFYDKLNINRELRDLDFKKNLDAKTAICEEAEKLAQSDNCLTAFKELQKLHDAWKDLGPVSKQYREEIWERFKVATTVINKKYQSHFEEMKAEQTANLDAKTALCEKIEAILAQDINDSRLWNSLTKEIEQLQQQWKATGYATRKENQKIYDRFRAACDQFFTRKKAFYEEFKGEIEENLQKKIALCEEAEQLKESTDWKRTTDRFLSLQKKWKEIGSVPRKKSDELWKRFRGACDEFFEAKAQNMSKDRVAEKVQSKKEKLVARYKALEQELATKENNILFFAASKGNALLDAMQASIDSARAELKELEQKIREIEASERAQQDK